MLSSLAAYQCHLAAKKEDIIGALDPRKVQQKSVISRLYLLLSNFPYPYPTSPLPQPARHPDYCMLSLVPSCLPCLPSFSHSHTPLKTNVPGVIIGHLKLVLQIQFSSVAQSCLTLCEPMDCSTPGFPVHHQLPEFTQTHGDAIQPAHPLLSPSPPALNPSQHQGLFKWVSSLYQVAKILEFQL